MTQRSNRQRGRQLATRGGHRDAARRCSVCTVVPRRARAPAQRRKTRRAKSSRGALGRTGRTAAPAAQRAADTHSRRARRGAAETRVERTHACSAWALVSTAHARRKPVADSRARGVPLPRRGVGQPGARARVAPVSGCSLRMSTNCSPAASISTGSLTTRPSGRRSSAVPPSRGSLASSAGGMDGTRRRWRRRCSSACLRETRRTARWEARNEVC